MFKENNVSDKTVFFFIKYAKYSSNTHQFHDVWTNDTADAASHGARAQPWRPYSGGE